jgi:hypothetical protein
MFSNEVYRAKEISRSSLKEYYPREFSLQTAVYAVLNSRTRLLLFKIDYSCIIF